MGRITTHVLDTSNGRPGRAVAVSLYRLTEALQREKVASTRTNQDGRCDQPLCEGEDLTAGYYELDFEIGDYFRALTTGVATG
ncbi:MAG: hydroxyisourate hydrolase, partial [Alphaproteobacteria bacterium]|nr:hydroxyisourate hydrolase [Alphaproteobacteria bacterium]